MENCGAEHSASPLYAQVADVMRERIVKGDWPIDSRIPTLPALAGEFGVASVTVRQAVLLLKNEGLLSPEQGRGTFVRRKPETHPRMKVESSLIRLAELYRELAPRLIPLAEGRATPRLEPEDGSPAPSYHFLRRIHASERQSTSVISAYLDERIFELAPKRFRNELIIPVLMDLEGVRIGAARQILTISTAGAETASALNISISAPVAEVRRVVCSPDGTVIYLAELTYRGDFIRVEMDLLDQKAARKDSTPARRRRSCCQPGVACRRPKAPLTNVQAVALSSRIEASNLSLSVEP